MALPIPRVQTTSGKQIKEELKRVVVGEGDVVEEKENEFNDHETDHAPDVEEKTQQKVNFEFSQK